MMKLTTTDELPFIYMKTRQRLEKVLAHMPDEMQSDSEVAGPIRHAVALCTMYCGGEQATDCLCGKPRAD
jgi:hypothetical protein